MSMPAKQLQNGTYEFDYKRVPEQKSRWKALQDFVHDPAEGTYCGHTGKKWGNYFLMYNSTSEAKLEIIE